MPDVPGAPVDTAKDVGKAGAKTLKKIPLWAWIAIVGGGILIAAVAARSRAKVATDTGGDVPADPAADPAADQTGYQTDLPSPPIAYDGNVFGVGSGLGSSYNNPLPDPVGPNADTAPLISQPITVITGGGPTQRQADTHSAPAHRPAPGKTSSHGQAGLKRTGTNTYKNSAGKVFHRVGSGDNSHFVAGPPPKAHGKKRH